MPNLVNFDALSAEADKDVPRSNRTFYLDDDIYEWLQGRFRNRGGISKFVRTVLRACMLADQASGAQPSARE